MIVSEIFEMNFNSDLTKNMIDNYFIEKNIKPVKWAITGISKNKIKILASFEKKAL